MKLITKCAGVGAIATLALLAFTPVQAGAGSPGEFATLHVHKVVKGPVPADAVFVINVDCESTDKAVEVVVHDPPFSEDLTFGADGGEQLVYIGNASVCTVTETDDGGADSHTGAVVVDINDPTDFSATITNTFVEATTSVAPTTSSSVKALAAVAAPRFTG